MLQINDVAPDFQAETADGTTIKLSDYRNKKNVILYFYPKDFSLRCTQQACQFRDEFETLQKFDCEMIGISFDTPDSHSNFKKQNRLQYQLISDPDKSIARLFGVLRFGGYVPFVKRVTFVIDKSGIIKNVIHHEFIIANHVQEVRKTLERIS
jgi:thioredoxin-dependent peroxiredoxin